MTAISRPATWQSSRQAGTAQLRISELFGPTFQGEGPSTGRRAVFVRLAGCNLDCRWCDTPYSWEWRRYDRREHSRSIPVDEVAAWVLSQGSGLVVVTGGEPLLQHRAVSALASRVTEARCEIEVETNGTVPAADLLTAAIRFNVSPKLAGSGVPRRTRIRPQVLRDFASTGRAVFKFVVDDQGDVNELSQLQRELGLAPIWVMPQGRDPEGVLHKTRWLAEVALAHGWNLTSRLHVLLWGDTRGR